jgi:GTPase SAR1 family protein
VIIVIDVTQKDSLIDAEFWIKEMKFYTNNNKKDVVCYLVANKIDRLG